MKEKQPAEQSVNIRKLPLVKNLEKTGFRLYQLTNPVYETPEGNVRFPEPLSAERIRGMIITDTVDAMVERRAAQLEALQKPDDMIGLATEMQYDVGNMHFALEAQTADAFIQVAQKELGEIRTPDLINQYTDEAKMLLDKKVLASERGFMAWKARQRYQNIFAELNLRDDLKAGMDRYSGTPKQKITQLLQDTSISNDTKRTIVLQLTGTFPELNHAGIINNLKTLMDKQWLAYLPQDVAAQTNTEPVRDEAAPVETAPAAEAAPAAAEQQAVQTAPAGEVIDDKEITKPLGGLPPVAVIRARSQIQEALDHGTRPSKIREELFLAQLQSSQAPNDRLLLVMYKNRFMFNQPSAA